MHFYANRRRGNQGHLAVGVKITAEGVANKDAKGYASNSMSNLCRFHFSCEMLKKRLLLVIDFHGL